MKRAIFLAPIFLFSSPSVAQTVESVECVRWREFTTLNYSNAGYRVDTGDFNGDGFTDLLMSALNGPHICETPGTTCSSPNRFGAGNVFLVYGPIETVPSTLQAAPNCPSGARKGFIDLIQIAETHGVFFHGNQGKVFKHNGEGQYYNGDFAGSGAAFVGDVNGDGKDDIAIGATLFHDNPALPFPDVCSDGHGAACHQVPLGYTVGQSHHGRAYLILGREDLTGRVNLEEPLPDKITIAADVAHTKLGSDVGPAGDLNDDGIDDFYVGMASWDDPADPGKEGHGCVMVVYGIDGAAGESFSDLYQFPSDVDAGVLRAAYFVGPSGYSYGYVGPAAAVGDIDGDGVHDILIGEPLGQSNGIQTGRAYLVFGRAYDESAFPSEFLGRQNLKDVWNAGGTDLIRGVTFNGTRHGSNASWLGFALASAGDFNDDGINDLLFGAPLYRSHVSNDYPGDAYIVMGGPHLQTALAAYEMADAGTASFGADSIRLEVSGSHYQPETETGWAVAGGGDFNADGIDDIAVSSPGDTNGWGHVHVILGRSITPGFDYTNDQYIWSIYDEEAVGLDGTEPNQWVGYSIQFVPSLDGDAYDELLIGATGATGGGRVYLVRGRDLIVN